jgi:nitrate/TMAO reductase-like tetraheme cytochrome c subunit
MGRRVTRLFVTPIPALIIAAVIAVAGGTMGAVKYTEQPKFCATCHEMKPYYEAWSQGPHKDVSCVACHVDPGTVAEYSHKVVALKEVYDHFAKSPKFPQNDVDLPNARCVACHTKLPEVTKSGFQHALHVGKGTCISCHPDAGHKVSPEALEKEGVLRDVQTKTAAASLENTAAAHVKTSCTQCHDLNKVACETCHKPPHQPRGACETCHAPGPKWTFAHPSRAAKPDCTSCHTAPTKHFGNDCATCHNPSTPFAKTVFAHSAANQDCTKCHQAPPKHVPGACSTCHTPTIPFAKTVFKHTSNSCSTCHTRPATHIAAGAFCFGCHQAPGKDWAFTHPSSSACADCHSRPRGHFSGSCASCHSPRVPFKNTKFSHPSSGDCSSCHNPPRGHRTSGCSTCHRNPGRSWSFTHPSSNSCASCHRPPRGHFSGACSGCHSPKVAFAKATFRHPTTTSCQNCHRPPSGHRTSGCYTCHKQPGRSWAFTHTCSTACASCHRSPSSHYGTSCVSCHSPSRSWSSATFRHPSIPGGEHTYRSFACSKCHPSGPPKLYCSCHGGRPPVD